MDPGCPRTGVFYLGLIMRVQCYVDGFNLYHAIHDLGLNHLKWVNLRRLAEAFIPRSQTLTDVFYFSAYATWRPAAVRRHHEYVAALRHNMVVPIMGHFKEKQASCKNCGVTYIKREEKESDVNIAIRLIHEAHQDNFDRALIITADSDLCPAIKMVRAFFPQKKITVLTPPNRYEIARELRGLADTARIGQKHLKNNLLPQTIFDSCGAPIITRPHSYDPPPASVVPLASVTSPIVLTSVVAPSPLPVP